MMGHRADLKSGDAVDAITKRGRASHHWRAGERKAMALLCMALHDAGVPSDSFTGSQAGIITDTEHTKAKIVEVRGDRLREALAADPRAQNAAD